MANTTKDDFDYIDNSIKNISDDLSKIQEKINKSFEDTNIWADAAKSVSVAMSNTEKSVEIVESIEKKISEYKRKSKEISKDELKINENKRNALISERDLIKDSASGYEALMKIQNKSAEKKADWQSVINEFKIKENRLQRELDSEIENQIHLEDLARKYNNKAIELEVDKLESAKEMAVLEKAKLKRAIIMSEVNKHLLTPILKDSKEVVKLQTLISGIMKGSVSALLVIWDAALDRFIELDKTAGDFRKKTGLMIPQMEDIRKAVRSINVDMAKLGVTLEKAYESVAALYGSFQTTALVTVDMIRFSSQLSANVGIMVDDVAKFASRFSEISKTSGTTVKNVIYATVALSKMAGVVPREVMHDIATTSENTLKFLAKNPMQLMRAAVEARRLGSSLESISNSARGMLNYQDSMTSELEASALLNKNISFQLSRQLAWEGDIVASRQEALRQIEMAGDFTRMTVYQQEALAKAAGMTVDEIIKQQNLQAAFNEVMEYGTDAQKKAYTDYKEHNDSLRRNNQKTREELIATGVEFVRHQNMQAKMEQITNALAAAWTDIADALLPIADVIMPVIIGAAKLLAIIFKGIGYTLKSWVLLEYIGKSLTALCTEGGAFEKIVASISGWFIRWGTNVGKFFMEFKTVSSAVGKIVTWITKLSEGIGFLGKGVTIFARVGLVFGKWIPIIGWIIAAAQFIYTLFTDLGNIWSDDKMNIGQKIWASIKAIPNAIFDVLISPFIDLGVWVAKLFGVDISEDMVNGIKSTGK